jgi:tetratricopeptide (TPR) repeat protein
MHSPNQATTSRAKTWVIGLALAATVLVVYTQTWGQGFTFVNVDDGEYVYNNPHVTAGLSLSGVRWALTTLHFYNWHPLTWLSLQLDAQLFGTSAQGFHRTNVLLHAANSVLLFWLLQRMTGALWCSALVAALFAIHPTHVESVAWISERKDVLSTLFWLLTMAAYAWYAERPGVLRYLLVMLAFILGLMTKPMVVTLPAVLLLLDYWPLCRWPAEEPRKTRYAPASLPRLFVEKVPLLCLVALSVFLTLRAQTKLVQPLEQFPLSIRVANALVSWVKYIGMTLWPAELTIYYPHPRTPLVSWQPLAAVGLLAVLTVGLLLAGRKQRYLAVGWLWYLGTLVPVIGIVQVAGQALADRYTYIPTIGLFIIFAWGMADFCSRALAREMPVFVLTGIALAVLLVMTWFQIQHWRNSDALWRHALAVTGGNKVVHNELALALVEKGEQAEAVKHFEAALRLGSHSRTHGHLGMVLLQLDQYDEAARQLEKAVQLEPDWAKARLALGRVRERQGRHEEAIRHFTDALAIDPTLTEAHIGLASALAANGAFQQAEEQYEILLRAEPDSALLHDELGRLYKRQGRLKDAISQYDRALELQPSFHESWNNKGVAMEALGRFAQAADCYRHAVELDPKQLVYRLNLAYALRENGQQGPASTQYEVAFRLHSDWPQSVLAEAWTLATHPEPRRRNGKQALRSARIACQATGYQQPQALDILAAAHAELGQFDQAVSWERKALALLPDSVAPTIMSALQERLKLYERRQPYRETPAPGSPP